MVPASSQGFDDFDALCVGQQKTVPKRKREETKDRPKTERPFIHVLPGRSMYFPGPSRQRSLW